ncbi:hypothetical protein ICN18_08325 [Polynucleobacter sp. Ross1-W9]|uniref:hypothetical protein n=1 Tax=Polynucleobacter parvulilacunae TaxID=1855631 RepID=UPI001C0CDF43|nr:hypothetical protein [Polynucleobacter parvulilacunae]MBU3557634.1 hypothetical protein [Polynucleobacter parvulilacunae]
MTIQQFNANYLVHDDRLLFRINTINDEEYRFWFTRRVTVFILTATRHLLSKNLEKQHTPEAAKEIVQFGQEAAKVGQTGSDGKLSALPFKPASIYPVGTDPILVMDVKCSMAKEGAEDVLLLDLMLPAGGALNLKMAGNTLHAMCALLTQLAEHAQWLLAAPEGSQDMTTGSEPKNVGNDDKSSLH